jgi:hypothetical protein
MIFSPENTLTHSRAQPTTRSLLLQAIDIIPHCRYFLPQRGAGRTFSSFVIFVRFVVLLGFLVWLRPCCAGPVAVDGWGLKGVML